MSLLYLYVALDPPDCKFHVLYSYDTPPCIPSLYQFLAVEFKVSRTKVNEPDRLNAGVQNIY